MARELSVQSISIVKVLSDLVWLAQRELALIAEVEDRALVLLIKLYHLPLIVWMYDSERSVLIRFVGDIKFKWIEKSSYFMVKAVNCHSLLITAKKQCRKSFCIFITQTFRLGQVDLPILFYADPQVFSEEPIEVSV